MKKLLIIEDERTQADYLDLHFQSLAWQVSIAPDGVAGVMHVIREDWDVILSDIRMPRLDGFGALEIIKALKPDIPVVMYTGQAGKGDMYRSTSMGAYTCLLKPIDLDHLTRVIEEAIGE